MHYWMEVKHGAVSRAWFGRRNIVCYNSCKSMPSLEKSRTGSSFQKSLINETPKCLKNSWVTVLTKMPNRRYMSSWISTLKCKPTKQNVTKIIEVENNSLMSAVFLSDVQLFPTPQNASKFWGIWCSWKYPILRHPIINGTVANKMQ